jgi:hypothetical protein
VKISENLLKLSDFPFSYSLVGGLFLIFAGESVNFNDILRTEFAPVLAIMGFLGTALAISDPFGRLLKRIGIYLNRKDLPEGDFDFRRLEDTLERDDTFRSHPDFDRKRELMGRVRAMTRYSQDVKRSGRRIPREYDRDVRSLQLEIQRRMIDVEEEMNRLSKEADERVTTATAPPKRFLEDTLRFYRSLNDALVTLRFNLDVNLIGKRSVVFSYDF